MIKLLQEVAKSDGLAVLGFFCIIAFVILTIGVGASFNEARRASVVRAMVDKGVDPLAARCAIMPDADKDKLCLALVEGRAER